MGADMILATCMVPRVNASKFDGDKRKSWSQLRRVLKKRADKMGVRELLGVSLILGIEDSQDEMGTMREAVYSAIDGLVQPFLPRAVTTFSPDPGDTEAREFYVTGGLSFGDSPTERFDEVNILGASWVTAEPIEDHEFDECFEPFTPEIHDLRAGWPFKKIGEAFKDGSDDWFEITKEHADNVLNAVPPLRMLPGGFVVGEPVCDDSRGVVVHTVCLNRKGRWFARETAIDQIAQVDVELIRALEKLEKKAEKSLESEGDGA